MSFVSRLPIAATLVTFIAVVIMFALGFWQLQRAEEKTQRLESMQLAAQSNTLNLSQARDMREQALDMSVSLQGTIDKQHYFLLDNKIQQGRVGYEVLAPVSTLQGNVLVNFGWLAAPALRSELPRVTLPSVSQNFRGMLSIPKLNSLITETAVYDQQWPKILQQVDLAIMAQHYTQPLLPFVILLDEEQNSGYIRNWQAVVMAPEKHLGYAIQWFLLGGAAFIIFVIAQRKKLKRELE
jgi:surfeit locus 1 family protein